MAVSGIKRKQITISIPVVAYDSLVDLARRNGVSVSEYGRQLLEKEVIKHGLPLYCPPTGPSPD